MLTVMFGLVSVLLVVSPSEQSKAALDGLPTRSSAAQVRIFRDGQLRGSGTLVDRRWVLTSGHLIDPGDDPTRYSIRFGVVNNQADDPAHERQINQVVHHPDLVDLALVRFADPVPDGTWIPRLANEPPDAFDVARLYGWGSNTSTLTRESTIIADPEDTQNAGYLRAIDRYFEVTFRDVNPMVTVASTNPLDEGGGTFAPRGVLAGVHFGNAPYRDDNDFDNPIITILNYDIPVWTFRAWIQSVISGEGSSGSTSDEAPRRRLTEIPKKPSFAGGGSLPMTLPPQPDVCDEGEPSCTLPDPTWLRAALPGSGNYRGTALARCADAAGSTCSFDGTAYAKGAIGRLSLGPSRAPGTAPRSVMVWCETTAVFADDTSPRPALRVSFTNADHEPSPDGRGWWDVTPDQVTTADGKTPVNDTRFATC
jgi:hypothetical protein